MTIEKAINRLYWRFGGNGNKNPFPVNSEDGEALNTIIRTMNDLKSGLYETNQGFAKLYIFALAYFIKHYNTDLLDPIPQKELSKLLEKDISVLIQRFTDNLNSSERYVNLTSMVGELEHPMLADEKKKEAQFKKLKEELRKDPSKLENITGDAWKYEDVEEGLKQMISTALTRFKL